MLPGTLLPYVLQADGHPGNILIGKGAKVGLLDYGQSKQLSHAQRASLARLLQELDRCEPCTVGRPMCHEGRVSRHCIQYWCWPPCVAGGR